MKNVHSNCPTRLAPLGSKKHTNASEQTATVANLATPSVRGLHVRKIADSGVISYASAAGNEEQRPQQLANTVGTTEQLVHARMGASEQAATFANPSASAIGSLQVTKVADNNAVLHISANYNDGEDL